MMGDLWEYSDFEYHLNAALDWIFNESDGALGYHAVRGAVIDLADRYSMDSYKQGGAKAERLEKELSEARARLAEKMEECANIKCACGKRLDAEKLAYARKVGGMSRTQVTAQFGSESDLLDMLREYLVPGLEVEDGASEADSRAAVLDGILSKHSPRYREEKGEPMGAIERWRRG